LRLPHASFVLLNLYLIAFFWRGCEDFKKISWINWDTICLKNENGGFGVRRIKEFNLSLLDKWCWRLKEERWSFWIRVLSAKYGVEGSVISEGEKFSSSWWKNLLSIQSGVGVGVDNWFVDNLCRAVEDDINTLFGVILG